MLNRVVAKNFMSWADLNFNVTPGATLVDGWNEDDQRSEGSGKSAILNAISWCVFGKVPKDANVDDVIKDGETSCSVMLEFDNGDAIVRSRKPNDVYLVKAGVTVKGKDARETQTFIEEFIGCNFETFCQSVYFAQNYDKKFLTSNQEDKGKILSSIQNLQIFDKARKETMDLLKIEDANIAKLKTQKQVEDNNKTNFESQRALVKSFIQEKIQKHQSQVSMVTQQRDLISGHIKKTETDLEIIAQRTMEIDLNALAADEQELNQVKTEYSTQLSGIVYQKSQVDSIKKAILAKESEGKALASKYSNLEYKLNALNTTESTRYKALKLSRDNSADLTKNSSRNRLLLKVQQLEAFIANPTNTCPSCGTELATPDTSHSENELAQIKAEILEIESNVSNQVVSIEAQMEAEVEGSKVEATNVAAEMEGVLVQLQAVSEYMDQNPMPVLTTLLESEAELKRVISEIDSALYQTQQKKMQHSSLLTQHGSLMGQLEYYMQQHFQCGTQLAALGQPDTAQDELKLKSLETELSNVSVKLQELGALIDTSTLHAQRLESLKDGFKEIKSYVFTNALNELNFRTNEYLRELFEMEATVKFTNEDQKIESKITLDGKVRSLGLLSGGQNRRFNLAVDLALSDIVSYRKTSKLDILIFDEYFKDLSEVSMEKSLDLLKSRKSPVILIEHNSIFKNIMDNTFFVRLENGTSFESKP